MGGNVSPRITLRAEEVRAGVRLPMKVGVRLSEPVVNDRGERPPPTGTVERRKHSRIAAALGMERRGGGSLDRFCPVIRSLPELLGADRFTVNGDSELPC